MPSYKPGKAASEAEAEHGITEAIKMASNENPHPPIPAIVEAMTAAVTGVNRYGDNTCSDLRRAVADMIDVEAESVTIGAGSSALLGQIVDAFVDPGDRIVYPWRSFEYYPILAARSAAEAVTVPLADGHIDLDALAAAVTADTKLVFVATPNNPTGTAVTTAAIGSMLEAITTDTLVVIDEAYREFNDPAHGDPVTDLLPDHPNVLVTRTFSKGQGLAGLRVGYAVGLPDVIAQLIKVAAPFAVSNVAQAAAKAAIEHHHEIMDVVGELLVERQRVTERLGAAGIEHPAPYGNFVWIPIGERTDDLTLALERTGIVVRPFPPEGIRITIGTSDQNDRWIDTLIAHLSEGP